MLHALRNRSPLTASDMGMGLVKYNHPVDAHIAFSAWLASDPEVIRSRAAAPGSIMPGAPNVDLAAILAFIDLDAGRAAAQTVETFCGLGYVRSLFQPAPLAVGSPGAPAQALINQHAVVRDPLVALRALLLHASGLQRLPVSRLDGLGTVTAFTPTGLVLRDIYERMFFVISNSQYNPATAAITAVLEEWNQLTFHPGMVSTFTGRIVSLRRPPTDYWSFPFMHPTANVVNPDTTLITDVIAMTLLTKADKLSDPERLKSSAIDANQLDREDQLRSTAELLAAHAVAIGLLRFIVTDCYFQALISTPWLKPLFEAALERISLTARFKRASDVVAPYRVCGGPLSELWGRLNPTTATIDTIMDRPHPIYAVPKDVWEELMSNAFPSTATAPGMNVLTALGTTAMAEPSRRGTSARNYRVLETALLSPLGAVPGTTLLDRFVETRLALADLLAGSTETRVAQALKYILSKIGWTSAPTPRRSLPVSVFNLPVMADGTYASDSIDAVDLRAGRIIAASDGTGFASIHTAGSMILNTYGYGIGLVIPRPLDLADLGMPSAEEPRDYAGLSPAPAAVGVGARTFDFDSDARMLPNTIDEWARQMNVTAGEMQQMISTHPDKWVHLFDTTVNPPVPNAGIEIATTSSRISRIARSTIILGVPSASLCPTAEHFADDYTEIQDQIARQAAYEGDFGASWTPVTTVPDRYGGLAGTMPYTDPGPLDIVYVDTNDPALIKIIATWQPPTFVVDPALPSGNRADLLTVNQQYIASLVPA